MNDLVGEDDSNRRLDGRDQSWFLLRERIIGMTTCLLAVVDAAYNLGPEAELAMRTRLREVIEDSGRYACHPARIAEIVNVLRAFEPANLPLDP